MKKRVLSYLLIIVGLFVGGVVFKTVKSACGSCGSDKKSECKIGICEKCGASKAKCKCGKKKLACGCPVGKCTCGEKKKN